MREFEQKKRIRKVMYSRTMIFLLLILFIFLTHATLNVYKKQRTSRKNLDQVAEEYKKLDDREQSIKSSVDYLQTDKGIESEIRSKFRAVKQGEQVAIIINDEVKKEIPVTVEKSIWMKIINFFDII